ncbi:MAG: hypothetical protein ACN6O7_21945 [Sphingobacterium sp.]
MKTYQFRFNNSTKTSSILFWFFTALLSITLSITIFLIHSEPYFPIWLLLISFPLMLISINRLFKVASKRVSTEMITLDKDRFTSACFGSVLFSDITSIQIPASEISLLAGENYDYYKQTEVDPPYLVISITTDNGKILSWVLNEWGGLYNSTEDFSICFEFLTALTDQLFQQFHADESPKIYLKILDENGSWVRNI